VTLLPGFLAISGTWPTHPFHRKAAKAAEERKGCENGGPKPLEQVKGQHGVHVLIEDAHREISLRPFATFAALR
jgi:hypothetical protein